MFWTILVKTETWKLVNFVNIFQHYILIANLHLFLASRILYINKLFWIKLSIFIISFNLNFEYLKKKKKKKKTAKINKLNFTKHFVFSKFSLNQVIIKYIVVYNHSKDVIITSWFKWKIEKKIKLIKITRFEQNLIH